MSLFDNDVVCSAKLKISPLTTYTMFHYGTKENETSLPLGRGCLFCLPYDHSYTYFSNKILSYPVFRTSYVDVIAFIPPKITVLALRSIACCFSAMYSSGIVFLEEKARDS